MKRQVFVRADAAEDLRRAIAWYDNERDGLGAELLEDLDESLERIAEAPQSFPVVLAPIRRALLARFPYAVYFRAVSEDLQVVAIFHARRDPADLRAKLQ